jgi:hypothetical protein
MIVDTIVALSPINELHINFLHPQVMHQFYSRIHTFWCEHVNIDTCHTNRPTMQIIV